MAVRELASRLGIAWPTPHHEICDAETGEVLAVVDIAWPEGIQPGRAEPVALLLAPDPDTEAHLGERGYRFFASLRKLVWHLEERLGVDIDGDEVVGEVAPHGAGSETLTRTESLKPQLSQTTSARTAARSWNGRDYYVVLGQAGKTSRWAIARKYGLLNGGGGSRYWKPLRHLKTGHRVFAYVSGAGYVGIARVTGEMMPARSARVEVDGELQPLLDRPDLDAEWLEAARSEDPEQTEMVVPVDWIATRALDDAVWEKGLFALQVTACKLRDDRTIKTVEKATRYRRLISLPTRGRFDILPDALTNTARSARTVQADQHRYQADTLIDMAARLVELRLPAFKSIRQANIPLRPLTLLVGRNGSGKSNVLDALAVLSALAGGATFRDAVDGGRAGPLVRGGSEGCAPVGEDAFAIGCSVVVDKQCYNLDLTVGVRPNVQVINERLWTLRRSGPRFGESQDLLKTDPPQPDSGDIVARWDNKKQGPNPAVTFRASQLLTTQVATRVPATSQAGRDVRRIAEEVLAALSTVFILDPVPHQMREYVPEKDVRLRRNAENLSAVLAGLLKDEAMRDLLLEMTRSLSEAQVSEIATVSSDLGDVMVAIQEQIGSMERPMPARLMSDGTLRFLAIAAALLDQSQELRDSDESHSGRTLVVEEIENGLHPSQAAVLLNHLKTSVRTGVSTLATTHSPAILDALEGKDHNSVMVCGRGSDGWSKVTRLTDFPDYFEVAGRGSLGAAAVRDRLRPIEGPMEAPRSLVDVLELR